jgi:hypothetical protein
MRRFPDNSPGNEATSVFRLFLLPNHFVMPPSSDAMRRKARTLGLPPARLGSGSTQTTRAINVEQALAARAGFQVLLVEKESLGGTFVATHSLFAFYA